MNDLILYAILALMGIALIYVISKVRQPIEIRQTREKREKDDVAEGIGEIGDILKELQPEIEKGLKLKDEQKESLSHWINTIDKVTKSKMVKWAIRKFT